MQKWVPLNYSFVHIQNSFTYLVFENPNSKELVILNEASEALLNSILNMNKKNNLKAAIFA